MSATASYADDHTQTCFENDSYFNFTGETLEGSPSAIQNSITPVHTQSPSRDSERNIRPSDDKHGELNPEELDEMIIRRKSALLNAIGRFKAKYPNQMTLPDYMMHAYVILYTKNENTLLTYEIITSHTKIDPSILSNIMRSQTLSRLEQEEFDLDAAGIFNADFENDEQLAILDKQFTWLCQCCCQVVDEAEDVTVTQHMEQKNGNNVGSNAGDVKSGEKSKSKEDEGQAKCTSFNFAKLVPVENLPNDVMYEALRQHGNRLIQRSLYSAPRRLYASPGWSSNKDAAARLSSSAPEMRGFVDEIQRYSVDANQQEEYYGEERRLSVRQSALLRKKYL
ncbi:hypothetical protein BBOV_II000450 [Babesia bovis T2Bo]|uniref:Uncharacterized protein n=1 Tax=Babesia bovis TaxID=5865 RepID=A7ASU4_BABBO|nr:hypothetical protein BBOV_II000450 [Babesia bovis T2Bo]EDO06005.1 hypothetical protein BBOV_II000450 [Babesia bovis T2Bo]|eukprot:XP_001609573.1 hypothetical protein [Babesia bovis T2Bo]